MKSLTLAFNNFNIQQIPRAENYGTNLLSKLATLALNELPKEVFFKVLQYPSSEGSKRVIQVDPEPNWIKPLILYLKEGILPRDPKEDQKLKNQTSRYILYENKLYKRSYSLPLLKCLQPSKVDYVLRKVQEGVYENHFGARLLSYKLL